VRFVPDELNYKKDKLKENKLVKALAPLFNLYVNDAFSASHREHASIVAFPKMMESCLGRVFQQELQAIQKLNMANALYVLGGAKPEDNIKIVKSNRVLSSGLFGPFCLMSLGIRLGKQNTIMKEDLKNYSSIIKSNRRNIILPVDLAIENKKKRLDLNIDEFPVNSEIFDLGINTIEKYVGEILNAKAVFFKGLVGLCNKPDFEIGTKALLLALAQNKGFTVVSGGHTLTMLEKFNIPKSSFSYVSLSGGALIHYLANRTLPGIEAMKNNKIDADLYKQFKNSIEDIKEGRVRRVK
jgi:phosphoglycerate kinase